MTPETIKGMILSAIQNKIGVYYFSGINIPSIWVGNPPSGVSVSGIEVIIDEAPERSSAGNKIVGETWRITIIDHVGEPSLIYEVIQKLRLVFRGDVVFQQRPKAIEIRDLKIIPQVTILWSTKELL